MCCHWLEGPSTCQSSMFTFVNEIAHISCFYVIGKGIQGLCSLTQGQKIKTDIKRSEQGENMKQDDRMYWYSCLESGDKIN